MRFLLIRLSGWLSGWVVDVYVVKEIYFTLQGEGVHSGRAAVFCRFTGCNLWSGKEVDRKNAVCQFCDTDFLGTDGPGGGRFADASLLVDAIFECWPDDCGVQPFVVFTGGEPALQLDEGLIEALHERGFYVAVETNGTCALPAGIDWVCVSPKAGTDLEIVAGDELKLVYPQTGIAPVDFAGLDFGCFFLQPMDGVRRLENTELAMDYCRANPQWRLSVQLHKVLNIP